MTTQYLPLSIHKGQVKWQWLTFRAYQHRELRRSIGGLFCKFPVKLFNTGISDDLIQALCDLPCKYITSNRPSSQVIKPGKVTLCHRALIFLGIKISESPHIASGEIHEKLGYRV